MEMTAYDMSALFAQLGQASDAEAITRFMESHSPLPSSMRLHEASFWTTSQACFLRDAMLEDGEWAEVVDQLNLELHSRHEPLVSC